MNVFIAGPLRAVLAAAAGYLVGKGFIGADDVQPLIGAVMVILTAAWSVKDKMAAKAKVDAALNSAPDGMRLVPVARTDDPRVYTPPGD